MDVVPDRIRVPRSTLCSQRVRGRLSRAKQRHRVSHIEEDGSQGPMFQPVYPEATVPAALRCLHLSFRPDDVISFHSAAALLRTALQDVGVAAHERPQAKPFKGAALDAHGKLSTPHTSRRVGQCGDKLDHLVEAIAAGFPDDDERGEQLHEDVRLALRFALSFP